MARANALRRTQNVDQMRSLGFLGQLSGDKVLAPVGQSLLGQAQHAEAAGVEADQAAATQKQHSLMLAMAAQKDKELQQYRQDTLAEQKATHGEHAQEFRLRLMEAMDARKARADASKAASEERTLAPKWKAFTEDMDSAKGRGNLDAKTEAMVRRGDDLEGLLSTPGPMSPNKVEEAVSMAAFIANNGNVPSVEQIHGMKPKTFSGDWANWMQYISGHPQDAGVQEFMGQLKGQSERIKSIGAAQMQRSFLRKLSKHPDVMRAKKDDALAHLHAIGIEPDMYDANTLAPTFDPVSNALAEAAFGPDEQKAAEWARDPKNANDPNRSAVLKKLGLTR